METIVRKKSLTPLKAAVFAFTLAVAAAALPSLASTASNTTIVNTATVNFADGNGVAQPAVQASASVTVSLIPSAVNLSSPVAQTINQGQTASLLYTITGTANGPDTYALSVPVTPGNMSSVTAGFTTPIALGGSTLAAPLVNGSTTITVPYDGIASNANVNGLAPLSTINIGGVIYTIAAGGINKTNSVATNTVIITLQTAINTATTTLLVGGIIGEQKTFTVTVPSGTVTTGGSGTQVVAVTATANNNGLGAPNPATTQSPTTTITVNRPTLTVVKSVSVDNGATFGVTGVAPPGTSLIYRIVATNGSTTAAATAVAFTDAIPQFLTYVPNSGRFATLTGTAYSGATPLTDIGTDADGYTVSGSTVTYNPGSPGVGTVPANSSLVLFFRATIN